MSSFENNNHNKIINTEKEENLSIDSDKELSLQNSLNDFLKKSDGSMDINSILQEAMDPELIDTAKEKVGELFEGNQPMGNFFNSIFDKMSHAANQSQNGEDFFANLIKGVMGRIGQMDDPDVKNMMGSLPTNMTDELKNFQATNPFKFEFNKDLPKNIDKDELELEINSKINNSFNDCIKNFSSELSQKITIGEPIYLKKILEKRNDIDDTDKGSDDEYSGESDICDSDCDKWSVEDNMDDGDKDDSVIKITI